MNITDIIAAYIHEILEEADGKEARLKRNELAAEIGCVPSQINYVITSRFTPEHGYIVESRRGGGGYIMIRQVQHDSSTEAIMHTVNSIGDSLDFMTASTIMDNLVDREAIPKRLAEVILSAISNRAYKEIPPEIRDNLRAIQFKYMLTAWNA